MQTELFMNPVRIFILKGWNFTRRINYLIILCDKRQRVLQQDRMRSLKVIYTGCFLG